MYLKSLELVGFKSFADKTRLDFLPGMTTIVGPNGCGKSNVSDAVRWVLGEQSAKKLRGGNMVECIFSGTDNRPALGMAEVSLTLADCDTDLGLEYNEVTVTRRVFPTGEGQYFINKTACRLKDIQRLFMDTGIGTNSYSLMEQGKIDQILSSKPEDRRAVFEEASGISKYKADRKEALRKLDHTEANLQRLADIIREVKRQIGSLQRQAGKARRYQALHDELRGMDLYITRHQIEAMNNRVQELETDLEATTGRIAEGRERLQAAEANCTTTRQEVGEIELATGQKFEAKIQAEGQLRQNEEQIRMNRERIAELHALTDRDNRDLDAAKTQIETHGRSIRELEEMLRSAEETHAQAKAELDERDRQRAERQAVLEAVRTRTNELRARASELEHGGQRLQTELSELESREQAGVIQRERLIAEQAQLDRTVAQYAKQLREKTTQKETLGDDVQRGRDQIAELAAKAAALAADIAARSEQCQSIENEAVSKRAKIEVLERDMESQDLPGGTKAVLDPDNPLGIDTVAVLGSLADQIDVEAGYRIAVEVALRAHLDAIVVRDEAAATAIVRQLEQREGGATRLLAATVSEGPADAPACALVGDPLADHVRCREHVGPMIARLLANVRIVDTLDAIPENIPAQLTYVTRDGALRRGNGACERWVADEASANPLTRKHVLTDLQQGLDATTGRITVARQALDALRADAAAQQRAIDEARETLDGKRHALAVAVGEAQAQEQELAQANRRFETVSHELHELNRKHADSDQGKVDIARKIEANREERAAVRNESEEKASALRELEDERAQLFDQVLDCKVRFTEARQRAEHIVKQKDDLAIRIAELEDVVKGRSEGIVGYRATSERLTEAIGLAESKMVSLRERVTEVAAELQVLQEQRTAREGELASAEEELRTCRASIDELRERHSHLEVTMAEDRMRRQHAVERVTTEYKMSIDAVMTEPEPYWPGERPDDNAIVERVAEIREKLESMGPVNLVAIEECQEHEERFEFLSKQQSDLEAAKKQLLETIRTINETSAEMFAAAFATINENFQGTFKKLFNGGTATLVLEEDGDVLECGIEIVARPPGKKLQSISLLSGGERTMTAVSLLFALYMVKPSPFCVLDEIDAALDDANIARFIEMLKSFLNQSQFIVITHSRQTIAAASAIYGVTMPERGVSQVVSMQFNAASNGNGNGTAGAEAIEELEPALL